MSRTDKDTPFWTRFEYAEPYHFCSRGRSYQKFNRDCDLPNEPPHRSREFYHWYAQRHLLTVCHWVPADQMDSQNRYIRSKRAWRRKLFHGPQRRAVRDAARNVVQGNRMIEFPDGRARPSVLEDLY